MTASPLVTLADQETGLGLVRLNGELDRTTFQLRPLCRHRRAGRALRPRERPPRCPARRQRATQRWCASRCRWGRWRCFSASNFPFAFSVLGGDTASALAAGCSVVVKGPHRPPAPLRPRVRSGAAGAQGAGPAGRGWWAWSRAAAMRWGVRLVRHPAIAAGAFTGSTRGGAALQAEANARPRPIPFYGELGSINPVVVLPGALGTRGRRTGGDAGQLDHAGLRAVLHQPGRDRAGRWAAPHDTDTAANDAFVDHLRTALAAQQPPPDADRGHAPSLRPRCGTHQQEAGAVALLAEPSAGRAPRPFLAQVSAEGFRGLCCAARRGVRALQPHRPSRVDGTGPGRCSTRWAAA